MNQWCVVAKVPMDEGAVRYGSGGMDRTSGVYTTPGVQVGANPFDQPLGPKLFLFYVTDEVEANRLQGELARANPGIEYGVAKLQSVAVSKAAPPVISKFTEKGLMPA